MMKKILFLLCALNFVTVIAQVGVGTTVPNAQLDINSTNSGILIPRVSLNSLSVAAPILNPTGAALATSTMVFHDGSNNIVSGYYYWDGTKWQAIGKSQDKGLQYYVFSATTGTAPATEKSNINATIFSSGSVTGLLNNNTLNTLRGTLTTNYIILFTGSLYVETAGDFQLQSYSDDGARVVIDGIPVLNRWVDQASTTVNGSLIFLAKGKHKIEFWYYQNGGGQEMIFTWLKNANGNIGVVNSSLFTIE